MADAVSEHVPGWQRTWRKGSTIICSRGTKENKHPRTCTARYVGEFCRAAAMPLPNRYPLHSQARISDLLGAALSMEAVILRSYFVLVSATARDLHADV